MISDWYLNHCTEMIEKEEEFLKRIEESKGHMWGPPIASAEAHAKKNIEIYKRIIEESQK